MSNHQVEGINSQRCYQRPEECHETATSFSLPSVLPTASRVILKNNTHSKRSFFCLTLLKAFHDLYNKNYSLSQAHRPYIMWRLFISSASSASSCTLSHTQSLGPSLVLHPQCLYYTLYYMPGELGFMLFTKWDHHGSACFISPFPSKRGLQLPDRSWPTTVKLSFNTLLVTFIEFTTDRSQLPIPLFIYLCLLHPLEYELHLRRTLPFFFILVFPSPSTELNICTYMYNFCFQQTYICFQQTSYPVEDTVLEAVRGIGVNMITSLS